LEPEKLAAAPKDDRHLPDLSFGLYGELVIFDNVDKTVRVVANAEITEGADVGMVYKDACRRADSLVQRLSQPALTRLADIDPNSSPKLPFTSNFTQDTFCQAVIAGKEYIKAGDIFQFVPSQRLRVKSAADPLDV